MFMFTVHVLKEIIYLPPSIVVSFIMTRVRNKSFRVMLLQESNQQRDGVMKQSYCSHSEVLIQPRILTLETPSVNDYTCLICYQFIIRLRLCGVSAIQVPLQVIPETVIVSESLKKKKRTTSDQSKC